MSSDVEMTATNSSTQRPPSPSKKSGRSSPANSRRRSSSSKRKCSVRPLSDSVHSTGSSPLVSAVTQPDAQVPTKAKVEEEEGITETEKYCRKEEKDYPDIVLKPEDANAWPELCDVLTKHDGDQVKGHYQNIDTLLVLSGLFSAVVTTLIVEANKRLQQDPADATVQLLHQISMQLTSLSVNSGFINSTYVPPSSLPFSLSPSAVVIGVFWYMSLALSLVTASLGMLVKQWLREYQSKSKVSPEDYCQIRMFRAPGLRKYKVAEIASFLPIILQFSLILFFIGLIIFALSIHPLIASFVIIIVAIWSTFIFGTTLAPIFSPLCPYKTPLLKSMFSQFRDFLARQRERIKESSIKSYFHFLPDPLFIEEPTSDMNKETKIKVLMSAYETFQDIKSWDIVMRCVDLNSPLESLRMLTTLVTQKHGSKITSDSDLRPLFDQAQLRLLLKIMTACLRRASFVALKGGEGAWFKSTEVVHFVTLRRLYWAFTSSGGSDAALDNIVKRLTEHEHVSSIPHHFDFTLSYVFLAHPGALPSLFPKEIDFIQLKSIIDGANGALDNSSGSGAGSKYNSSLPHLLELCRISFLCAGRAAEHALYLWESGFLQLTGRLAELLQSISYPERDVDTEDVFRAQCALDMAMRLHTKVPDFVDKSLFQALHVYSVKMFNLGVDNGPETWGYHIWPRNNVLSTGEVPGSVSGADWEEVLQGKEYVGFRILDDGNDREEWYHEDL
ncbi:hypothetical protein NLI96_g1455 [Meripilus lineatus]|uniref:DUF6535 domain-containing protein n=1 Tax=Meripilus lineatus TaxID=2056292 RepID=A0AAD5VCJ3_9APHY|nr:hypothetical protein NLI96_g1455 [Physisporinus lineatus]